MRGKFEDIERFYKGKTVLVTGHTGFKGSWLALWLQEMGAKVVGYALAPQSEKYIWNLIKQKEQVMDIRGDIRDQERVKQVIDEYKPDVVFHLAAKAIVRESYDHPRETVETNVLGTVNVLEALRSQGKGVGVMITTDKCYKNKEKKEGYKEDDELGGFDPYSASKACAEVVIGMYRNIMKGEKGRIASVRAGNVIGGGDWGKDRIVPDLMQAYEEGKELVVRNPDAVRPWQFVLEPLYGYLLVGMKLYQGEPVDEAWNFGPTEEMHIPVKELVNELGKELRFSKVVYGKSDEKKHETGRLVLNWEKAKKRLGWHPQLNKRETIQLVAEWYKKYRESDVYELCKNQIAAYTQKLV